MQKMVVVDANGAPTTDQSALTFGHTIRRGLAADARSPVVLRSIAPGLDDPIFVAGFGRRVRMFAPALVAVGVSTG